MVFNFLSATNQMKALILVGTLAFQINLSTEKEGRALEEEKFIKTITTNKRNHQNGVQPRCVFLKNVQNFFYKIKSNSI